MKKTYTEEQKNEVLVRFFAGEPIASLSEDTGIAKSTLYTRSKSGEKKKNKALNMTDYRILKQRCETLEKLVEILQLSPCAVSAPLHDRYQVIKDLSDHYSVNLLCQTLKVAKGTLSKAYYERNPKAGLIFHTDQGANYTSHTFASFCKTLGITQSFSRKASPYDNSVMDAFFKTMKAEELYRNQYRSERHLRENIQNYIEFYNEKRPHQMNRYQTPNAIEEAYYKRHSEEQNCLPFY